MTWRPPTVMVRSARWPARSLILASSAVRSALPGWYCLTGSLRGWGTRGTAFLFPTFPARTRRSRDRLPGYHVLEFLGGVPRELVSLGGVDGEGGVVVSRVGGGDHA